MRTSRPVHTRPWRNATFAGPGDDDRRRIRPTGLPPFRASLAGGRIDERRDNADGSGRHRGLKRLHDSPREIACEVLCKISGKISCKLLCGTSGKRVAPALRTPNHTLCRYHLVSRLADTMAVADDLRHSGKTAGNTAGDGVSLNHAFLRPLMSQLSSEDLR